MCSPCIYCVLGVGFASQIRTFLMWNCFVKSVSGAWSPPGCGSECVCVTSKADPAAWGKKGTVDPNWRWVENSPCCRCVSAAQTNWTQVDTFKANSFELFWANFQPQQALLLLHHLPSELLELEIIGYGVIITKGYMGSLWRIPSLRGHPWSCWAGNTSLCC